MVNPRESAFTNHAFYLIPSQPETEARVQPEIRLELRCLGGSPIPHGYLAARRRVERMMTQWWKAMSTVRSRHRPAVQLPLAARAPEYPARWIRAQARKLSADRVGAPNDSIHHATSFSTKGYFTFGDRMGNRADGLEIIPRAAEDVLKPLENPFQRDALR
jgi:hypothetical protein